MLGSVAYCFQRAMACPGGSTAPGPSAGPLMDRRESHCTQEAPDSSTDVWRGEASSPEACSICLGPVKNRSFTDSCFHTFCFVCLLEWAKVRAVCPLCKQPFQSIIHNVRSIQDYDQYHLRPEENGSFEAPDGRRFRYSTTMTHDRWMMAVQRDQERQLRMLQRPSRFQPPVRDQPSGATSNFRNHIYLQGLRVRQVTASHGQPTRYRDVRPEFLRSNPALLHRLVPWLNRELNVLLHHHGDQVRFLLELIMDLVQRFSIQSEEFAEHIRPYMGTRTAHFQHEFLYFARSPYDIVEYDRHVVYDEDAPVHQVGSSSSSEDDVIMLSPGRIPLPDCPPQQPPAVRQGAPLETPTPMYYSMSSVMESDTARSGWESPTPGPSHLTYPSPPQPSRQGMAPTPPIEEITLSSTPDHDSPVQVISSEQPSLLSPAGQTSATEDPASDVQAISPGTTTDGHDGYQLSSAPTDPSESQDVAVDPSSQPATESGQQSGEPAAAPSVTSPNSNPEPPAGTSNAAEEESDEDDLIIIATEKAWEERSPIPLSSASDSEPEPEPEPPAMMDKKGSHSGRRTSRTPTPTYADRAYLWETNRESPRRQERRKRRRYSSDSSHSSLSSRRDAYHKKNKKRSRYRSRSASSDRYRSSYINRKNTRRDRSDSYSRRSRSISRTRRRHRSRSWSPADRYERSREDLSRRRRSRSNSYRRSPETSRYRRRDRSRSDSRARARRRRSRSDSWDRNQRNRYRSRSTSRGRRHRSRSGSRPRRHERSVSRSSYRRGRRSRSTSYNKRPNKKSRRDKSPRRQESPARGKDKTKTKKRKRAPVSQWTPFIIKVEKPDDYAPEGGSKSSGATTGKKATTAAKAAKVKTSTSETAKSKTAEQRTKSTDEAPSAAKSKTNNLSKSKSHESVSKSRSTSDSGSKSGANHTAKSKSAASSTTKPKGPSESKSHGNQAGASSSAGVASKSSSQRARSNSGVENSNTEKRRTNSGTATSNSDRQRSNKETGKTSSNSQPQKSASNQQKGNLQSDKSASNRQRTNSQSDKTTASRQRTTSQSDKANSNKQNSTAGRIRTNSQTENTEGSRKRTNSQNEKVTSNRQITATSQNDKSATNRKRTNSQTEKPASNREKSNSQSDKSKTTQQRSSNQPETSASKARRVSGGESQKAAASGPRGSAEDRNSQRHSQPTNKQNSQTNRARTNSATEKSVTNKNSTSSKPSGRQVNKVSSAESSKSTEPRPTNKHNDSSTHSKASDILSRNRHQELDKSQSQPGSRPQDSDPSAARAGHTTSKTNNGRQPLTTGSADGKNKTKSSQTVRHENESGTTNKRTNVSDGSRPRKVSDSDKSKSASSSVSRKPGLSSSSANSKKPGSHNQTNHEHSAKSTPISSRQSSHRPDASKPQSSHRPDASKPRARTISDGACDKSVTEKPVSRPRNRSESSMSDRGAATAPGKGQPGQKAVAQRPRTSSSGSGQSGDGASGRQRSVSGPQSRPETAGQDKRPEGPSRPRSKSGPTEGCSGKNTSQAPGQRRNSEGNKQLADSTSKPTKSQTISPGAKILRPSGASVAPTQTKRLRQVQSLLMARDISKPALYDDLDVSLKVDGPAGDMGGPRTTVHASLELPFSPEAARSPGPQPSQTTPPGEHTNSDSSLLTQTSSSDSESSHVELSTDSSIIPENKQKKYTKVVRRAKVAACAVEMSDSDSSRSVTSDLSRGCSSASSNVSAVSSSSLNSSADFSCSGETGEVAVAASTSSDVEIVEASLGQHCPAAILSPQPAAAIVVSEETGSDLEVLTVLPGQPVTEDPSTLNQEAAQSSDLSAVSPSPPSPRPSNLQPESPVCVEIQANDVEVHMTPDPGLCVLSSETSDAMTDAPSSPNVPVDSQPPPALLSSSSAADQDVSCSSQSLSDPQPVTLSDTSDSADDPTPTPPPAEPVSVSAMPASQEEVVPAASLLQFLSRRQQTASSMTNGSSSPVPLPAPTEASPAVEESCDAEASARICSVVQDTLAKVCPRAGSPPSPPPPCPLQHDVFMPRAYDSDSNLVALAGLARAGGLEAEPSAMEVESGVGEAYIEAAPVLFDMTGEEEGSADPADLTASLDTSHSANDSTPDWPLQTGALEPATPLGDGATDADMDSSLLAGLPIEWTTVSSLDSGNHGHKRGLSGERGASSDDDSVDEDTRHHSGGKRRPSALEGTEGLH